MRKLIAIALLTLAASGFAKGKGGHHKHKKPPADPPAFIEADG